MQEIPNHHVRPGSLRQYTNNYYIEFTQIISNYLQEPHKKYCLHSRSASTDAKRQEVGQVCIRRWFVNYAEVYVSNAITVVRVHAMQVYVNYILCEIGVLELLKIEKVNFNQCRHCIVLLLIFCINLKSRHFSPEIKKFSVPSHC